VSDRTAQLLREVHAGVAAMAAGAGRIQRSLSELERSEAWRESYATFADFCEHELGLPVETLEPFMSCPLPEPESSH